MFISEIFHSIQGEGELTGVPSVFIRTAGCNLRCSWCDTKYASWYPEGSEMSRGEILEAATSFGCNHVVLTGGEPMVASGIHELALDLVDMDRHVTIETAGTVSPNGIACDLASISPKLSNSTPDAKGLAIRHEKIRINHEAVRQWISKYEFQLKFVIVTEGDVQEMNEFLSMIPPVNPWKILLMPEGIEPDSTKSRKVADLCKQHGYRYCHRVHIDLFGNTKGT